MRRRHTVALLAAAGLILAGCGNGGTGEDAAPTNPDVEVDPTPQELDSDAPALEELDLTLPEPLVGREIVDPGWTTTPAELDNMFLGIAEPGEDSDALRFIALDSSGTLLWQAERPPSCSGFALTRDGETPVAVLTDIDTSGDSMQTTASGYELGTGEQLWGPVDVPGPHVGPGAVFAEPAPGAAMGDTGPRIALDPGTGEQLFAEERDDEGTLQGAALIGEYEGLMLRGEDGELIAEDASGAELWRSELAGAAEAESVAGTQAPHGSALVSNEDEDGLLLNLSDGATIATDVSDVQQDAASATYVTLEGEVLRAYDDTGQLWSQPVDADTRLAAAGGVLIFLRSQEEVAAHNVVTGEVAEAYASGKEGPLAVPSLASAEGAMTFSVSEDGVALATVEFVEEPQPGPTS